MIRKQKKNITGVCPLPSDREMIRKVTQEITFQYLQMIFFPSFRMFFLHSLLLVVVRLQSYKMPAKSVFFMFWLKITENKTKKKWEKQCYVVVVVIFFNFGTQADWIPQGRWFLGNLLWPIHQSKITTIAPAPILNGTIHWDWANFFKEKKTIEEKSTQEIRHELF